MAIPLKYLYARPWLDQMGTCTQSFLKCEHGDIRNTLQGLRRQDADEERTGMYLQRALQGVRGGAVPD